MEAGDVRTGSEHQTNVMTGETTTSAGLMGADFEVAGSTAEKSKSLLMKAGDVTTGVQQQTNARDNDIFNILSCRHLQV